MLQSIVMVAASVGLGGCVISERPLVAPDQSTDVSRMRGEWEQVEPLQPHLSRVTNVFKEPDEGWPAHVMLSVHTAFLKNGTQDQIKTHVYVAKIGDHEYLHAIRDGSIGRDLDQAGWQQSTGRQFHIWYMRRTDDEFALHLVDTQKVSKHFQQAPWKGLEKWGAGTTEGFWNIKTEDVGKVRALLNQQGPFSVFKDQPAVKYRKVVHAIADPCS